ncbi:MAG: 16S rRNA (adenine(1518)-N(6)/adenine(1519)-N(6))-dimethyltransferase RsmA [candidate division WOR-3 bacterium]|nr:16S rRNA (adenine(1518)-N(6)/adenine(1519)-N(6))-dimethyltransferase RsmA [candidate division WOR-3 bacterium]
MRREMLGQHFLNSTRVAERIARAAEVKDELVVEIGPGKGILTRQLAILAKKVIAVEIDGRLARFLEDSRIPRVDVLHLDFLKVNLRDFGHAVVVGNIPYGISSLIIEKLIGSKNFVKKALLTVQKEYGSKIVAALGHRGYGHLSICANYHFEIRRLFSVPARYFTPSPKVSSVVVALQPKKGIFDEINEGEFFEFVAGVFRYRRKSLKNAILKHLRWLPDGADHDLLAKRPQELSIIDFYRIYQLILEKR